MNNQEKVLVIGANGLVGNAIFKLLKVKELEIKGTCFSRPSEDLIPLDITNQKDLEKCLAEIKPSVIFFCPNFSGGVNRIEDEKDKAETFHLAPVETIVGFCKNKNTKLVYFSTDYVFGDSDHKIKEDEPTAPMNFYGILKNKTENLIKENISKYLIIRTTNVFGFDPTTKTPNFFMQVYRKLKNDEKIEIGKDQVATPTFVDDLASCAIELVFSNKFGTYHVVGDEYIPRYEWAKKISQKLGLNENLVFAVESGPQSVNRPTKLQLSNEKIKSNINIKFKSIEESLEAILKEIKTGQG